MPIFCDLQLPDSSWRYIADDHVPATDPQALGHTYTAGIVDLDEVRIAQQYVHGGLVQTEYGQLVLSPAALATWPPPATMECWVRYLAPGATPAVSPNSDVLVMAKAVLAEWDGMSVRYDLTQPSPTDTIADTLIAGTLADVCDSVGYGLYIPGTVSGTGVLSYAGRSPAPSVYYRVEGSRATLPLLGDIAAFFTHRIVISPVGGATMTDTTQKVGTSLALTTADVANITYLRGDRYRRYQASYVQPYIRNIEMRISEAGGTSLVALRGVDIAKTVGRALSKPDAVAAAVRDPRYTPYDPSLSGYPVSNAVDGSTSTIWATTSGWFAPDDPAQICLSMAVASGTIAEYALTSRTQTPYAAPTKWDLYGYDVNRSKYQYITSVESPDWGSAEPRRYTVPADTDWPVQVDGDLGATDTWTAAQVGNQASYSVIATALGLIKTLTQQTRVRVTLPLGRGVVPHIGQQLTITDDTTPTTTSSYLIVASLTYNFADQLIVAEGPGVTSR